VQKGTLKNTKFQVRKAIKAQVLTIRTNNHKVSYFYAQDSERS